MPNNVAFNFHRHFVIGAREARRHFPFPMACEVKAVNLEVILDTRSPRNNLRRVQTAETMLVCVYLDPTTLKKNGYFAQQMAFLTNSDASLTEKLKFPRLSKKIV